MPTLQYSQSDTFTPSRLAFSTTIRLATDPSTVRLPAKVLDMASASQAVSCLGAGIAWSTGSINKTAGTLLTRFERAAETRLNKSTGRSSSQLHLSISQWATTWSWKAWTTMNRLVNMTSR